MCWSSLSFLRLGLQTWASTSWLHLARNNQILFKGYAIWNSWAASCRSVYLRRCKSVHMYSDVSPVLHICGQPVDLHLELHHFPTFLPPALPVDRGTSFHQWIPARKQDELGQSTPGSIVSWVSWKQFRWEAFPAAKLSSWFLKISLHPENHLSVTLINYHPSTCIGYKQHVVSSTPTTLLSLVLN